MRNVGPEGALPLLRLGELLSNVFTHFLKVTVSLLGLVGSGGRESGERGERVGRERKERGRREGRKGGEREEGERRKSRELTLWKKKQ